MFAAKSMVVSTSCVLRVSHCSSMISSVPVALDSLVLVESACAVPKKRIFKNDLVHFQNSFCIKLKYIPFNLGGSGGRARVENLTFLSALAATP